MSFKLILVIIVILLISGSGLMVLRRANQHKKSTETVQHTITSSFKVRYLPLGDSYTIGQSEPESQNFPNQLVNKLKSDGVSIGIVANPAVTGYTTQDVIDNELPLIPKLKPTFVTLLIGVNDYVQGVSIQKFQSNLEYIISDIQKQLPNPQNVVLITVPDFGKTPTGAQFGDPTELATGVQSFNTVIKQVAASHKLPVADIFPISQGVATDPSLIASDGLHPSPAEYALWVSIIYPVVKQNIAF
jgi:acyl-CoA thioesterase-1